MGWIKLHRDIFDNWLWSEQPFSKAQAWIDLLLLADPKDNKFPYKNEIVKAKRGTVYRSITWLSSRWGWGRDKTRTFLKQLESDNMVTLNTTVNSTTITIVKYSFFQDRQPTNKAVNKTVNKTANTTLNQQQTIQRADTYKNNKEYTKNYKEEKKKAFVDSKPVEVETKVDPEEEGPELEWDDPEEAYQRHMRERYGENWEDEHI